MAAEPDSERENRNSLATPQTAAPLLVTLHYLQRRIRIKRTASHGNTSLGSTWLRVGHQVPDPRLTGSTCRKLCKCIFLLVTATACAFRPLESARLLRLGASSHPRPARILGTPAVIAAAGGGSQAELVRRRCRWLALQEGLCGINRLHPLDGIDLVHLGD